MVPNGKRRTESFMNRTVLGFDDFDKDGRGPVGRVYGKSEAILATASREFDRCSPFFGKRNFFLSVEEVHELGLVDLELELPLCGWIESEANDSPAILATAQDFG